MANYLVTGGAGFIGSNLVGALVARGDAVRVVDNLVTGRRENMAYWGERVDFIEGDLCEIDVCQAAVRDMDYVLHQAAVPSVPRSVANPLLCHEANVTATVNLLVAARDAHVKRFVLAGSSSAYGNQPVVFKSEELAPHPLSPYAAAKVACEYYLQAFATCYGMETVTLRYFNVFGPCQDPDSPYSAVIPNFIRALHRGEAPVIHGDGSQARDFTFVENNVQANLLAAVAAIPARGEIYNIACGAPVTVLSLFEAIRKQMGVDLSPVFEAARVGDVHTSVASIERAQQSLGYRVTVPFAEGLSRTVAWYCERLGGS
ncbi:MAG: NAD-dependent epimerase/dehydratase family protein [Candidatus Hydrogenedentes bacterium]|nr:NAD-dependent epimerase/dehydratase family protein [Candidatus Hydrogenedentota bacterium]